MRLHQRNNEGIKGNWLVHLKTELLRIQELISLIEQVDFFDMDSIDENSGKINLSRKAQNNRLFRQI